MEVCPKLIRGIGQGATTRPALENQSQARCKAKPAFPKASRLGKRQLAGGQPPGQTGNQITLDTSPTKQSPTCTCTCQPALPVKSSQSAGPSLRIQQKPLLLNTARIPIRQKLRNSVEAPQENAAEAFEYSARSRIQQKLAKYNRKFKLQQKLKDTTEIPEYIKKLRLQQEFLNTVCILE